MPVLEKAQDELWKGQASCAYWHGIFGGIYLNHLRYSLYNHLINGRNLIDTINYGNVDWQKTEEIDFDCDGFTEVLINSNKLNIYVDPLDGGSIFEMDCKPMDLIF